MGEITTEAGKVLIEAFTAKPSEPDFAIRISESSVIRHAVPLIEAEAVAAERERIATAVKGISLPPGPGFAWMDGHKPFIAAVLRIVEGQEP